MTDLQLDPITWNTERHLQYKPKHFIVTTTPLTNASKKWIYDNLKGRFAIVGSDNSDDDFLSFFDEYPAFEDPTEATFYELTWA